MTKKIDHKKIMDLSDKHGLTNKQTNALVEIIKDPTRSTKDIMISAGYAPSTAANGEMSVTRNTAIKNAVVEYLKGDSVSNKMKDYYSRMLDRNDEDLQEAKFKLDVVKELHKVRGDHAPSKKDIRKVNVDVMFGPPESDEED